jgi:hypothetical protein
MRHPSKGHFKTHELSLPANGTLNYFSDGKQLHVASETQHFGTAGRAL